MSEKRRVQERVRRERVEAIVAEWGVEKPITWDPVPRFAAVTSEGPPEAGRHSPSRLVLAADRRDMAEGLRADLEEGRLSHGRLWDLDAQFYPWGNLALAYELRIGEELIRPVHAVSVEGQGGGLYLFADQLDAEAFCRAVHRRDGRAEITTELLHQNDGADFLIDSERGD
jgi:hypothetical protein